MQSVLVKPPLPFKRISLLGSPTLALALVVMQYSSHTPMCRSADLGVNVDRPGERTRDPRWSTGLTTIRPWGVEYKADLADSSVEAIRDGRQPSLLSFLAEVTGGRARTI